MRFLAVKNFEQFQHYRDRAPPWIKLHNAVLEDYEFARLPDASKWHLAAIWLLASRTNNRIPYDPSWIASKIGARSKVDLDTLVSAGFLVMISTATDPVAEPEQNASAPLERAEERRGRAEERRGETLHQPPAAPAEFGRFWQAYPRKVGKGAAEKAWKSALSRASPEQILDAVQRAEWHGNPRFIPHPATWLNQHRWLDEPPRDAVLAALDLDADEAPILRLQ